MSTVEASVHTVEINGVQIPVGPQPEDGPATKILNDIPLVSKEYQRYVKVPIETHLELTRQFGNSYSIHDMLSYLFIKVRRLDERA